MKNLTLTLLAVFMTTCFTFSQNDINCKKTCMVEKTIHEGALLGVKFGCQCGEKKKKGVLIQEIVDGSAADKSILQAGDVILSVDGKKTKRRDNIIQAINKMDPFQKATFEYSRDGFVNSVDVILGARTTRIELVEVCCDVKEDLFSSENITVYPNPAVNEINVSFTKIEAGTYNFEIYNTNGVRLFDDSQTLKKGEFSKKIDIERLDKGVYVIKVTRNSKTFSSLFAIK